MILYDEGKWSILFAFQLHGSVIDRCVVLSVPCALLAVALNITLQRYPETRTQLEGDLSASVHQGFSFVLGFLIVFRTQQAYSRWWEGGTLLQQLRGDWFNACSNLMAFLNADKRMAQEVTQLQHKLVRLFSLLYGFALRQVSETRENTPLEFINLDGFDARSLAYLDECHDACEVVLQWLQRLIVEANSGDLINIAPPILARVYNQLGQGIVKLNNARKIKEFPVPFSLAQMIAIMLLLHLVSTALFCAIAVSHPVVCGVAAFIVSSSFWGVNFIAVELENPFGDDANDLPLQEMQVDLNKSLVGLLNPLAREPPTYTYLPERDRVVGNGASLRETFDMTTYLRDMRKRMPAGPLQPASVDSAALVEQPLAAGPPEPREPPEVKVDNCLQGTCHGGSAMTGSGSDSNYRDSNLDLAPPSWLGKFGSRILHHGHDAPAANGEARRSE